MCSGIATIDRWSRRVCTKHLQMHCHVGIDKSAILQLEWEFNWRPLVASVGCVTFAASVWPTKLKISKWSLLLACMACGWCSRIWPRPDWPMNCNLIRTICTIAAIDQINRNTQFLRGFIFFRSDIACRTQQIVLKRDEMVSNNKCIVVRMMSFAMCAGLCRQATLNDDIECSIVWPHKSAECEYEECDVKEVVFSDGSPTTNHQLITRQHRLYASACCIRMWKGNPAARSNALIIMSELLPK